MHDKPTDETNSATKPATAQSGGVADSPNGMADLPGLVDELTTADPAEAPDVADEIAAVLEASLDSGPSASSDAENRDSGPAPDDR